MKKKIGLLIILFVFLFVQGCDLTNYTLTISDVVDWFTNFFATAVPAVVCWIETVMFNFLNFVMTDLGNNIILPAVELLPQYSLPTVDFTSLPFINYAAYFFPISEAVTAMKFFLEFYLIFRLGKILFRGLKIFR